MPMLIDISSLRADAVKMGDLAGQAISNAVRSLIDRDTDLARKVIDDDAAIDRLESEIDTKVPRRIVPNAGGAGGSGP